MYLREIITSNYVKIYARVFIDALFTQMKNNSRYQEGGETVWIVRHWTVREQVTDKWRHTAVGCHNIENTHWKCLLQTLQQTSLCYRQHIKTMELVHGCLQDSLQVSLSVHNSLKIYSKESLGVVGVSGPWVSGGWADLGLSSLSN